MATAANTTQLVLTVNGTQGVALKLGEKTSVTAKAGQRYRVVKDGEEAAAKESEAQAAKDGVGVDVTGLKNDWHTLVQNALTEATLQMPSSDGFVTTGKHGVHSEHLSYLLDEMQSLARAHPEGVW